MDNYLEDENGCWIFQGRLNNSGYGSVQYEKRTQGAHRVSYVIHKGPIPEGLIVCHSCDVRSCINPDHLWIGTHADNTKDMFRKGRGYRPPSKDICANGHMYSETAYFSPEGRRACSRCVSEAGVRYKDRRRTPKFLPETVKSVPRNYQRFKPGTRYQCSTCAGFYGLRNDGRLNTHSVAWDNKKWYCNGEPMLAIHFTKWTEIKNDDREERNV